MTRTLALTLALLAPTATQARVPQHAIDTYCAEHPEVEFHQAAAPPESGAWVIDLQTGETERVPTQTPSVTEEPALAPTATTADDEETVLRSVTVWQQVPSQQVAPQNFYLKAGNMIVWPKANANACQQIDTGDEIGALLAQQAAVLRSLAATGLASQAGMAFTLTERDQTDWLYTNYDQTLGELTQMSVAIVGDIARLDQAVLSFPDTDEILRGRQARRAQRLCMDQGELLNSYSDLWVEVVTAAAMITRARQNAGLSPVRWIEDWLGEQDLDVVQAQLASQDDIPEPPACLDDLDRRLRDLGVGVCVDR